MASSGPRPRAAGRSTPLVGAKKPHAGAVSQAPTARSNSSAAPMHGTALAVRVWASSQPAGTSKPVRCRPLRMRPRALHPPLQAGPPRHTPAPASPRKWRWSGRSTACPSARGARLHGLAPQSARKARAHSPAMTRPKCLWARTTGGAGVGAPKKRACLTPCPTLCPAPCLPPPAAHVVRRQFQPVLAPNYYRGGVKFLLELSQRQARELCALFREQRRR